MQQRTILFQAYGNEGILLECKFALLQLLKYNDSNAFNMVLYTDNELFFKPVLQQFSHYETVQLNQETIKEWRGEIDFVHRVKIEMLLHFFTTHSGTVIYFDTDTYCNASITPIFDAIEKGSIFMHTHEGNLADRNSIVFKKWNRFLKAGNIQYNGNAITNIDGIQMWNAGVLGFSDQYLPKLKKVLELTDQIYPTFSKHTVEQFAFSYIFQKTTSIQAADKIIYHYWDLKEYKTLLKYFFEKNQPLSLQQQSGKLQTMLPELIFTEKMLYKKLPFFKKWGKQKWAIDQYLALADRD
jgi:hypothetical protein